MKNDIIDMEFLRKDGWTYQDHPQMLSKYWNYILTGYGKVNIDYIFLSYAEYDNVFKRGQLMLGPKARANLAEYRKNNPIPN